MELAWNFHAHHLMEFKLAASELGGFSLRLAVLVLLLWCGWNAIFHTIWGDEYFLYTPHYAWAFLTMALLGWQRLPLRWLVAVALPIAIANILTLWTYRTLLLTITA